MSKECFSAEPCKPRLVWSGRETRKEAAPLPSQVVEIVFPQRADVKSLREWDALRAEARQAEQTRLPGLRRPAQLGLGGDPGAGDGRAALLPLNRLIWTNDNLVALTALRHGDDQHEPLEGKVDLIYIDPPFAVQNDFRIDIDIENGVADEKLPTLIEELAYTDTWKNGLDSYLSMLRERLELLKRLLSPTGSIYVHCDWHAGHYIKVLMDETFGLENFRNEIIWHYRFRMMASSRIYNRKHDTILFYAMSEDTALQPIMEPWTRESLMASRKQAIVLEEGTGREMMWIPGPKGQSKWKLKYIDEILAEGKAADDVWNNDVIEMSIATSSAHERVGFPTQKPVSLL